MSAAKPLVVKFGGSSLARREQLARIAAGLAARQRAGQRLVVVVSARGRQTDRLRQLAGALASRPPARELDLLLSSGEQMSAALLSMAIQEAGGRARALTASQAGIVTDASFGRASVRRVSIPALQRILDDGCLPVVAGFQGVTSSGEITTLGRGGSDTTAVALAAALGWACEIRTDVAGVFTADPRDVDAARLRPALLYDEMVQLSLFGARVLHWTAADQARLHRVPLVVRHSLKPGGGTRLVARLRAQQPPVTAITSTSDRVELRLRARTDGAPEQLAECAGPGAVVVAKSSGRFRVFVKADEVATLLDALPDGMDLQEHPWPVALVSVVGPAASSAQTLAALSAARTRDHVDCAPLELTESRLTARADPAGRARLVAALHDRLARQGALDWPGRRKAS